MAAISGKNLSGCARLCSRAVRLGLRKPRTAFLLLRMACWVGALSLMVRALPLTTSMKALTPLRRRVLTTSDPEALKTHTAELLDMLLAADFLFLTPTCWKRAPVLYRFLALKGIETRVVFGVRKEDPSDLVGHAWLEAGGRPLLEKTLPNYTVTFSFPA